MNDALLIVNLGIGSFEENAEMTAVEAACMSAAMEMDLEVYRAVMPPAISKHYKTDDASSGIKETLEKMHEEGIDRVVVQPTFLLYGKEYDEILATLQLYVHEFEEIVLAKPLLSGPQEMIELADCLKYHYGTRNEGIILMGHGTEHVANMTYLAFQEILRRRGFLRAYVGTLQGWPKIEDVIPELRTAGETDVMLVPMLIASGEASINDMAGEDAKSWKSILEAEGFNVTCYYKGLGILEIVQDIYVRHMREAYKEFA